MFEYKVFSTGINATIEEALNSCVGAGYEPVSHHIDTNRRVTIIGKREKERLNVHVVREVKVPIIHAAISN